MDKLKGPLAVVALLTLLFASAMPTTIPRAHAVTALIMGGTYQPDPAKVPNFMADTARLYLAPTSSCQVDNCELVSMVTPEELAPFVGTLTLDESVAQGVTDLNAGLLNRLASHPGEKIVISGSSQSAVIASIEKRNLTNASSTVRSQLEFVFTGNPDRPNGGVLERFAPLSIPFLGFTFNGATSTDTGITTTDISFQYDIAADFPRYPLNVFALLNTFIGIGIHGSYVLTRDGYTEAELADAIADPANRQTYGDTTYITIPTKHLPLVQPLRDFGTSTGTTAFTTPVADLIEPTLRVLVELGYDRSIGYGTPAPAGLFPKIDPVKLRADLAAASDKGINDALADLAAPASSSRARPPSAPSARATKAGPKVTSLSAKKSSTPVTRPHRLHRDAKGSPENVNSGASQPDRTARQRTSAP
ncbi:hypothetical protein BH09ACT7_BH09ACT7_51580 [soil metagenome]